MTTAPADGPGLVLLIDDHDDSTWALRTLLELAGHRVLVARTGAEGLALAQAHRPRAVVLDIGLPDLGGLEVARRLRQAEGTRDALLVALSGLGRELDADRARESGFDVQLDKPAELAELRDLIARGRPG